MKTILRSDVPDGPREAISRAESLLERSHCPHSGLCVAVDLVLGDGLLTTGVNHERDSSGLRLPEDNPESVELSAQALLQEALDPQTL